MNVYPFSDKWLPFSSRESGSSAPSRRTCRDNVTFRGVFDSGRGTCLTLFGKPNGDSPESISRTESRNLL